MHALYSLYVLFVLSKFMHGINFYSIRVISNYLYIYQLQYHGLKLLMFLYNLFHVRENRVNFCHALLKADLG